MWYTHGYEMISTNSQGGANSTNVMRYGFERERERENERERERERDLSIMMSEVESRFSRTFGWSGSSRPCFSILKQIEPHSGRLDVN